MLAYTLLLDNIETVAFDDVTFDDAVFDALIELIKAFVPMTVVADIVAQATLHAANCCTNALLLTTEFPIAFENITFPSVAVVTHAFEADILHDELV